MNTLSLNGTWILSGSNPDTGEKLSLNASVPGSVLNDIVNADIEKCDIFYRDNSQSFEKYENWDWHYEREFDVDAVGHKTELCFEKLDTYCDVYLNGILLASCLNGHIPYNFDVTDKVIIGKNKIDVYFRSPIREVKDRPLAVGAFTKERMNTRRMQCTYGWDWVARFVTCGMGKVSLNSYEENEARVDSVYVYTKSIDEYGAYIGISANINRDALGKVYTFEIADKEGYVVKTHKKYISYPRYDFNLSIENADLWYPLGYGAQPIYTLVVSCDDRVIHTEKFGIRTVKILQETDAEGSYNYNRCLELKKSNFDKVYDRNEEFSSFTLVVNGVKILCMGANWVPCEPYDKGGNEEKISEILRLSKEMGVNMIRVWGGGTFECEHFYDECSRLGIMVTQDFLMACGHYPEKEEWFISELRKEAEYAAKLMRNKPCLVWWTGDNENATAGNDVMEDYMGRASATYGIHPVLMELDPMRDFLPSSPYGGNLYASNTAGTTHNTNHLGDVFAYLEKDDLSDYKDAYKTISARFIAEEPTFGAVSTYSSKKFMTDGDIYGDDGYMREYHTKSNPDLAKSLYEYLLLLTEKILGKFEDGKDRDFKLKYIQFENVRNSLEQLRRERWFCSGDIFWQLNDCWPAYSGWSFIDYYNMPKAAYYSFKRCTKPTLCMIDKENDEYSVLVANDGNEDKAVEINVFSLNTKTGERREIYSGTAFALAGTTVRVFSFTKDDDSIIIAETENDRAFYKDGALKIEKCDVSYVLDETNKTVTFNADKYVHVVEIEGNLLLDDNCFSLLPDETRTVSFVKNNSEKPLELSVQAYTLKL